MNEKDEAVIKVNGLIKIEEIQSRIYTIRGVQVMIDRGLSLLYNVENRVLNQAVKRNRDRFSEEFMFQITGDEFNRSRSQIVTLNHKGGGTISAACFH